MQCVQSVTCGVSRLSHVVCDGSWAPPVQGDLLHTLDPKSATAKDFHPTSAPVKAILTKEIQFKLVHRASYLMEPRSLTISLPVPTATTLLYEGLL